MENGGTDFIAVELLKELKEESARKDAQLKEERRRNFIKEIVHIVVNLLLVAGFLFYLYQYDFIGTSTETYNAEGTYALIDSDGNVIGYDISEEELGRIWEVLDLGTSDSTQSYDQSQGEE